MFYLDVQADEGANIPLPDGMEECAIYIAGGTVQVDGEPMEEGCMAVLAPNARPPIRALKPARVMVLGGEPMDGPRILWWNFVASDQDLMDRAKDEWRQGRMKSVEGDPEYIPLPEE